MVFFGEYQVSFTGQGRLVLPKKIRELLQGNTFVLSKGFDTCLAGYSKNDWEERAKELMSVSLLDKDQIAKRRYIFSSASYIEVDDQGRFIVPKHLMKLFSDKKKVMIVGVGDHFELWDTKTWETYISDIDA